MCGRYALFRWPQALASLPGFPVGQPAQWNISPGASVLIQRQLDGQLQLAKALGLTPAWLTDLSRTPPMPAPKPWPSSRCFATRFACVAA